MADAAPGPARCGAAVATSAESAAEQLPAALRPARRPVPLSSLLPAVLLHGGMATMAPAARPSARLAGAGKQPRG